MSALVVGAGPVGLTAAIELLRRDVPVRIVDRVDRPHPHSKSIVLWPRALEAFARLGVADEIVERGVRMSAQNYYSGGRRTLRLGFGKVTGTSYPFAVSLPQQETEEVLRGALGRLGGKIEFGVRLTGFAQDEHGVRAELADSHAAFTHDTDWLIGADGSRSTVREHLGVPFEGATYPQQFLLADGECDTPLAHDEAHYFMTPKGVLVVVGLPGGLYRVFVSVAPNVDTSDPLAVIQAAATERSPVPVRLVGDQRTGLFQVQRRLAGRLRQGRVLLVGDAAHIHSPAGAQGLNTGIEDASALAWRIARGGRGPAAASLERWERERLYVAERVVADTDRQTRMWTLSGWRRTARDLAFAVGRLTGVTDRVVPARQAQLDLVLPGAPDRAGDLRTGARLPDGPLPDGSTLHDTLRTGDPALLVLVGAGTPAAAERARRFLAAAPTGGVHTRVVTGGPKLGLREPTAVLVRPDGVIDLIVPLADEPRLTAALREWAATAPTP
ncbi:FAD-dependent monooxygenase [Streptomyces lavendulocolor]|uniref:FAD-dependent monooxygenase n=1 Tax=Streptomyces lavendulocolor TaxID=67316 RepID=UPI003C30D514